MCGDASARTSVPRFTAPRLPRCAGAVALALALLLGAGIRPLPALASGLQVPAVGTLGSGPLAEDAASLHWNPAQLAALDQPQLLVGGHLIAGDLRYRRERRAAYQREDAFHFRLPIPADAIDPSRTGSEPTVRANPLGLAPSIFLAMPLGTARPATAAIGVYAPYAALVSLPDDGPQRFAVQEATIAAVHTTVSLGVEPVAGLRLGGGASLVLGYADIRRVQDFAALSELGDALAGPAINQPNDFGPDAPPAVRELEALARPIHLRDATGAGVTFQLGASADLGADWQLGASWQHGVPLTLRGRFVLDMDDPFFTGDLAAQGLEYAPRIEGRAQLGIRLPGSLHAGVRWRGHPAWTVDAWGTLTRWSTLEAFDVRVRSAGLAQPELGVGDASSLRIERQWRDTVGAESVVHHSPRDTWTIRGRGGLRTGASPDETVDMSSPDGTRIIAGAGIEQPLTSALSLHGDLLVHHVLRRTVAASRHDLANGTYRFTLLSAGLFLTLTPRG